VSLRPDDSQFSLAWRRIFVGREREMAALVGALEDALAGRGRLVLLSGEPGIGKTRLAEEFAVTVRDAGAQVFWGRCYEGDGAPAFWPWVYVLRAGMRRLDRQTLRSRLGTGAAALATLVPEIREQLDDLPAAPPGDSPETRFRLFDAVARFIGTLAERAPVVVVIDDLHGADQSSLLLLEFVARGLRELPVLIVGTYRDTGVRGEALAGILVDLAREPQTERIVLHGLSASEVAQLIKASTEVTPAEPLIALLHQRTEGNPLFVCEFLHALRGRYDQATLNEYTSLAVPLGVKAVIDRRLAPLSIACRRMLRVAAVIGREFVVHLLMLVLMIVGAAASEADTGDQAPSSRIEEAEATGIVEEMPDSRGTYRFAHALIRERLYDALPPSERARLHHQVATAIEGLPDVDAYLAELTYHFAEAEDHEPAVRYAQRAGDRAMALLAYEEAVRLYRVGLEALQRASGKPQPSDDWAGDRNEQRCELLLALGVAHNRAANMQESKRVLLEAAALARQLKRRDFLTRAALSFGSDFVWGESPEADLTRIGLLKEVCAAWSGEEHALHARLLARLALALKFAPDEAHSTDELSARAVAMARRAGDTASLAYALYARRACTWQVDDPQDRLRTATELVSSADQIGDTEILLQARMWRIHDLLETGDRIAASAEIEACRRLGAELRQPLYRWQAALVDVILPALEGRFAEAERLAGEAHALGHGEQARWGLALHQLAIRTVRGGLDELEASFKQAAEMYAMPPMRAYIAHIYAELGRPDDARREFELLAVTGFDLPRDQNWLLALAQLSGACAVVADPKRAAILYALLLPHQRYNVVGIGVELYWGPVAQYLGLLATTLGRWDDAARHFDAALAMNRRMGATPWLARTQYSYARMFLQRGSLADRRQAAQLLDDALRVADGLGMTDLAEQIRTLDVHEAPVQRVAASTAAADVAGLVPSDTNEFSREGEYWSIRYSNRTIRLRDSKGLQYIAHLLEHPSQEFHVADLAALGAADNNRGARNELGAILDPRATAELKQRLAELRAEIDDATGAGDLGRVDAGRREIEFIQEELSASYGLRGRARALGDSTERVRKAVTNQIRRALERISAVHPELARHLANSIRTGMACAYQPERPVHWRS